MEYVVVKAILFGLSMSMFLSPFLLIFREKEEDVGKPFTPILYKKLNLLGKIFILPFIAIFDFIGFAVLGFIATCIYILYALFGYKKAKKQKA